MKFLEKKKIDLKGNETLFDLYSGVGSIGIFLSDKVAKVCGIEPQAVEMANMNLEINNVTNAEYIARSGEQKIIEFEKRNIELDVIVVEPPRKRLDLDSSEYIIKFRPKK